MIRRELRHEHLSRVCRHRLCEPALCVRWHLHALLGHRPDAVTWLVALGLSFLLLGIAVLLVQKTRKQIVFKL